MYDVDARSRRVEDRLVAHFREAGVVPVPMSKFEWASPDLSDPSRLHRPYGWVPPCPTEGSHPDGCGCSACREGRDVELIVAPFCPALIAEQTAALDDATFERYLDVIGYVGSLHIVHRDLPWGERERKVEESLYETAPGSMQLLNQVQMAILDEITDQR